MDGAAAVARSTEAMNQVLKMATTKQMDHAQKLMQVTNEMALASQPGMGQLIDAMA
jgi:hypothetical protein